MRRRSDRYYFALLVPAFVVLLILHIQKDAYLFKAHHVDKRLQSSHHVWKNCVKSQTWNIEYDADKFLHSVPQILYNCSKNYTSINIDRILHVNISDSSYIPLSILPSTITDYYTGSPLENRLGQNACLVSSKLNPDQWTDVDRRAIRNGLIRILVDNQFYIYMNQMTSSIYLINISRRDCVTQYLKSSF